MIKVLVVEDSPVVQEFLIYILNSDPEISVIGTANNGEAALESVRRKKPDVITMDINMPKMDGFNATRRIMETHPTPIIIVSGNWNTKEVETTFRAIEAGALAVLQRPEGIGDPNYEASVKELIQTVKLMAEVKVVRRWARPQQAEGIHPISAPIQAKPNKIPLGIKIIAIGASTGGPPVLQTILSKLPENFPVPMLIVQHIASGFTFGFVEWLAKSSGFPVRVAIHGESLLPGHAYVAPDGLHMGAGANHCIVLSNDEPENRLRPSISYLFRTVANHYGKDAIGILLTGMGKDGAAPLKLMKRKGAVTIAQDEESSVIYGMPREAIRIDAATYVLSPEKIAEMLKTFVEKR